MSVSSPEFLVLLFVANSLFFLLPGASTRRLFFAACSIGFLATYVPNAASWLLLLGFLLSGYACGSVLRARPSRALLAGYLALLIGTFVVLKKYSFLEVVVARDSLNFGLEVVGLSYMLFRQIHFLVDSMQGQIESPSLASYLCYQVNPFTLLAGPIQRYQEFREYWRNPAPLLTDRHEILKSYLRLFVGVLKVVVLSTLFERGSSSFLGKLEAGAAGGLGPKALVYFLGMIYCYFFFLYMNFSGYCDVVIAGASLVGLKLPENFNNPLLARNISDHWTRWHITLGHWIRDYLFTPLYKAGVERFAARGLSVAVLSYLVAFTFAGFWHGSTGNFAVFGLLHGLGASAAKLWEAAIVRRSGRKGLREYLASTPIRVVATVATFHYVCFALLFWSKDLDRAWKILTIVFRSLIPSY